MHADEAEVNRLSERIIGCAFQVMNTLGAGFLEKAYESVLAHKLRRAGLAVSQQQVITARYDGIVVGEYAVDLLVEGTVMVELKTIKALDSAHDAQCINYSKATGQQLCLLLNFGKSRLEIQRFANGPRSGTLNLHPRASAVKLLAFLLCFCRHFGRLRVLPIT